MTSHDALTFQQPPERGNHMKAINAGYTTTDEYIAMFPKDRQKLLKQMRATIRAAAPGSTEKISYQMPAFALRTTLVWFSSLKDDIGFYPTGSGIAAFKRELSKYETTTGSVKFPVDEPLPVALITKIVKYRVAEDRKGATKKSYAKKTSKPRKSAARSAKS
jgi:uncharacterized protein YdhG (YjbR/CyaY superfamily)